VRKYIFDQFLEHSAPPVVEQVMSEFALSRDEASQVLHDLEEARHIALVKGTYRILMAFPFSAIATPFQVIARKRRYFANCAWDAIAFHAMLGEEVRVDSFCQHCGMPISIELAEGRAVRVEPEGAIVFLALPPTEWWADITATCSNTMVFFASTEHRDASVLCASADASATLTPEQTYTLSLATYPRKFDLDYARPSKEELLDHFAAMGLTGSYWTL
jgi:hypothetical protein